MKNSVKIKPVLLKGTAVVNGVAVVKKSKKVKINKYFTIIEGETVYSLISPSVMHLYKGKVFRNEGVDLTIEVVKDAANEYTEIRARMEKSGKATPITPIW